VAITEAIDLRGRVERWWRRTVWETPAREQSRPKAALAAVLRAWAHALRSFYPDMVELRANELTYRTLLALVPLLAVAFSLFRAFGGLRPAEDALQQLLVQNLGPGSAATAVSYIDTFVERVSTGAVAGVGVVFLVFTGVSLLASIEASMNALWRVERGRGLLDRFVVYWATMTVGPLLLALSLTLTSAREVATAGERIGAWAPGLAALAFGLAPWLFACVSMTLLYVIVPNTHVRWKAALGGGLVAGTLWELGKLAFTWASGSLLRYDAVYGAFGALPAFLLWLQVGWMIVLIGCKMTFVLQHARDLREERLQIEVGPAGRELLAIAFMVKVCRAFVAAEPPPTLSELLPGTRAALTAAQEVVARLEAVQLVRPVPAGERDGVEPEDEAYVPGRDPAAITLGEALGAFRDQGRPVAALMTGEAAIRQARDLLARRDKAAREVDGTTFAELVREMKDADRAGAAASAG
jgi:membrane protein